MGTKNNSSFDNGQQFVWDATSIELAQTCPRKYYYKMHQNLRPKNTSVHLIFGGIYARALETFYIYLTQDMTKDEALRRVVREALVASWEYEDCKACMSGMLQVADQELAPCHFCNGTGKAEGGKPVEFNDKYNRKTRMSLIRTIVWYVEEFHDETDNLIQTYYLQSGKPAVELSFKIELNEEIILSGHLDRVVTMNGHRYWMDQKTTGATISSYYFEQFNPHNQFSLYTWAGQTILDSPIKGGVIDAAQIAVGFTRFARGFATRTQAQLDEWLDNTIETIYRMRQYSKSQTFPMNLSACGNYGGCEFRALCSRTPSVREKFLVGDYSEEAPWDPAKSR